MPIEGVDVYAIRGHEVLKIEVKTSQGNKFVTGIAQKGFLDYGSDAADFWVLFQILPDQNGMFEHFFVLGHQEICTEQKERNKPYAEKYFASHGKPFDISTGVDNLTVADIKQYEPVVENRRSAPWSGKPRVGRA